jgi:hypothetical protein
MEQADEPGSFRSASTDLDRVAADPWVRNALDRYEQIRRNTMRALGSRTSESGSVISDLMGAITGRITSGG